MPCSAWCSRAMVLRGLQCQRVSALGSPAATSRYALQGSPASARPMLGCSPVTTAEPGAGTTPGAPARRSAACTAATTPAYPLPEVRAAWPQCGSSRLGSPPSCGAVDRYHPLCPQLHCFLSPEKPGICPMVTEAPTGAAPCGTACAGDWQCPGDEKCCSSTCGHVCSAPEQGEDTATRAAVLHGCDGNAPMGQDVGWCCHRAGAQSPGVQPAGQAGACSAGGACPCPCCPFPPLRQTW